MKLLLYLMTRLKVDNSWASMLFYLYQMNARWFVVTAIVTQEKSPQLENRKLEVSSHVFLHKCYRRQLIKRLSFFTGRDYNHYSLKLFRGERGHWEMRGRGKKTNKLEIILKHLKMYLIRNSFQVMLFSIVMCNISAQRILWTTKNITT